MTQRIQLVELSGIKTSYKKKNTQERFDISELGGNANLVTPDFKDVLEKINRFVWQEDGELYTTDCFRSWETQQKAYEDYRLGKRKTFISPAGSSFHGAGRAIDISVYELNFKKAKKNQWLSIFWDIAIPLGLNPIIKKPDMSQSECWHFEYMGNDWSEPYKFIKNSEVAKCCVLDCGMWNLKEDKEKTKVMFLQSQLIRLEYYHIGAVDGILGNRTKEVMKSLKIDNLTIDEAIESVKVM